MTDDLTLARNVITKAEIISARLVSSNTKTTIRAASEAGTEPVRFKREPSAVRSDKGFRVIAALGAAVMASEADKEPAVLIEATFEIEYLLPAELNAQQEELDAFARVNGLFNAWPYFREFVQSTMARMQLPPLVLPLYRVPRPTQAVSPSPETKNLPAGNEGSNEPTHPPKTE